MVSFAFCTNWIQSLWRRKLVKRNAEWKVLDHKGSTLIFRNQVTQQGWQAVTEKMRDAKQYGQKRRLLPPQICFLLPEPIGTVEGTFISCVCKSVGRFSNSEVFRAMTKSPSHLSTPQTFTQLSPAFPCPAHLQLGNTSLPFFSFLHRSTSCLHSVS